MVSRLVFLLHAAVETPAAATFLFAPSRQLSPGLFSSPAAAAEVALVLQNLGGLLASSVLLSVMVAVWGTPQNMSPSLRGGLAMALAVYHVFPCRRAFLRQRRSIGTHGPQGKTLGGPAVHLAVHVVCFAALALAGVADVCG